MKDNIEIYKIQRKNFLNLLKEKEAEIEKMKENQKQHWILEKAIKEVKIMRSFLLSCDMVVTTAHEQDKAMSGLVDSHRQEIKKFVDVRPTRNLDDGADRRVRQLSWT